MPTVTMTLTINLPEGASLDVAVERHEVDGAANRGAGPALYPPEVAEAIEALTPSRYQKHVRSYLEAAVADLGCSVEVPGGNRTDYFNVFAPPRCRRARVAGITYKSSRTAVFAGEVDLSRFDHAVETLNSGRYAYPKLPHLDSDGAVHEALELTRIAIERFER